MSFEEKALAEVRQLHRRLSLLERMAADPKATADGLRRQDLATAAKKAGFHNPELAARILAGDEGDPDELVAALGKAEPYMRQADMNEVLRAGRRGRAGRSR